MGFKDVFLNKGWAGRTLSRAETAERVNPLIRLHYELNHSYEHAIRTLSDPSAVETMNTLQKIARTDISKLSETVLSAGRPSYNGTDLEPNDYDLGTDDDQIIDRLNELEGEFEKRLSQELSEEHQIRTKAVLTVVLENGRARLDFLRDLAKNRRRSARTT